MPGDFANQEGYHFHFPDSTAIPAQPILREEDNLQHVIWQLVMATNKVVPLYTIYANRAVNLINLRAYHRERIALDSNTITLTLIFNLPQHIEMIAVTRFMALCLERTKIVISLRNSVHVSLCLVSV